MITIRLLFIFLCSMLASSCTNSSHMVLYQDVGLGFKGAVRAQNGNIRIRLGYKRDFAAIIPKVQRPDTEEPDAGSVFVTSRADFNGIAIPEVDEIIATGDAAANLANDPQAKLIFDP